MYQSITPRARGTSQETPAPQRLAGRPAPAAEARAPIAHRHAAHSLERIPTQRPVPVASTGESPIQMTKKKKKKGYAAAAKDAVVNNPGTTLGGAAALGASALAYSGLAAATVGATPLVVGGALALGAGALWDWWRGGPKKGLQLPGKPIPSGRPAKPDALTTKKTGNRFGGNALTANHKYPFNMLHTDMNAAIGGNKNARANLATWSERENPDETVGVPGVTWTRHNLFDGPLQETRADDPGHDIDAHFTASGNVTPRSELAVDLAAGGGLRGFDHEELTRRLEELGTEQRQTRSGFDPDEWEATAEGGMWKQKGRPDGWKDWSPEQRQKYVKAHSLRAAAAKDDRKDEKRDDKKKRS